jgi:hypothetical protein
VTKLLSSYHTYLAPNYVLLNPILYSPEYQENHRPQTPTNSQSKIVPLPTMLPSHDHILDQNGNGLSSISDYQASTVNEPQLPSTSAFEMHKKIRYCIIRCLLWRHLSTMAGWRCSRMFLISNSRLDVRECLFNALPGR